jgi:hypothetical protein
MNPAYIEHLFVVLRAPVIFVTRGTVTSQVYLLRTAVIHKDRCHSETDTRILCEESKANGTHTHTRHKSRSWLPGIATFLQPRSFGHWNLWGQNRQHLSALASWWDVIMIVVKWFYNSLDFVYGCYWKRSVAICSVHVSEPSVPIKDGGFLD